MNLLTGALLLALAKSVYYINVFITCKLTNGGSTHYIEEHITSKFV